MSRFSALVAWKGPGWGCLIWCFVVAGGCGDSGGTDPVVDSSPDAGHRDDGSPVGRDSGPGGGLDASQRDAGSHLDSGDGQVDNDGGIVVGNFDPNLLAAATDQRPALIALPGGEFSMGSPLAETGRAAHEGPVHTVRLPPFAICQTEVTQSQYRAVTSANPSSETCSCDQSCGDDYPVYCVSWFAAVAYLNALSLAEGLPVCYEGTEPNISWTAGCMGYRLPTEAEWEFAARAGTTTAYAHGDDVASLDSYAWYGDNSGDHPHPVAGLQPTLWGVNVELFDMHGNLWEWVWDRYFSDYYTVSPSDFPVNSDRFDQCTAPGCRVMRGGGYLNPASSQRSAVRNSTWPAQEVANLGFRCVRSLPTSID